MKKYFKILGMVIFSLLILSNSKVFADNLLNNSDFGNGVNGWSFAGIPFIATTSPVHTPPYAAQNQVIDLTDQDFWGQIYQEFNYSVGQSAYGTMWVKTNISPLASAKAGVMLEFLNSANDVLLQVKSEIGGQTDWRLLYVAGIAPPGTAKVRLSGYLWAADDDTYAVGGYAYVDDAVLSTEYIAPPAPQTTLINANFENGVNDWTQFSGYPWWVSPSPVHSGNYAAAHTIYNIPDQDYWSQLYQEVVASPGDRIDVSLWAKTDINPLAAANGGILVHFIDANGIVIDRLESYIGGLTDWQLLTVSGSAPIGTVKVRFNCRVWALEDDPYAIGGKVYFDDATLQITHRQIFRRAPNYIIP